MRRRRNAFTLLELLAVIAIIMVLAGLLYAAATSAYQSAKINRTKAVIEILATACENYWSVYHDYPYPNPNNIGYRDDQGVAHLLSDNLKSLGAAYYAGNAWTEQAYNVGLVYLLSMPRQPEPFVTTQQNWFQPVKDAQGKIVAGPDGRTLYVVVDAFKKNDGTLTYIRVQRSDTVNTDATLDPDGNASYQNTYVRLTSAGPDLTFTGTNPRNGNNYTKDNIERYIKR